MQTIIKGIFNGRKCGHNALQKKGQLDTPNRQTNDPYGRVRDLTILHRDIKVHTDEYTFTLKIEVSYRELVGERHWGWMWMEAS